MKRQNVVKILALISFLLAIVMSWWLIDFLESEGHRAEIRLLPDGQHVEVPSIWRGADQHVRPMMAFPIILAGLGVIASWLRNTFGKSVLLVSVLLLGGFIVLGIGSIGLFYLPAMVVLGIAAVNNDIESLR